ncbi:MAG: hypothetical protein EBV03_12280, partial [Proteobacteria bacterium]|nr:hypothetical protein [Pseudomonadota bacterium]
MLRILNSTARLRVSTFTQFVESGVVSAEWLFCGTGPMSPRLPKDPGVVAPEIATKINSAYPVFDTTLAVPWLNETGAIQAFSGSVPQELPPAYLKLANDLFKLRAANLGVIMYVDVDVIQAGCGWRVHEFLRNKHVTGLVLSTAAAVCDLWPVTDLAATVLDAGRRGLGGGEAFGQMAAGNSELRETSLLAAAYDLGVPVLVHTSIGESVTHAAPALCGAHLGAALGVIGYIDMLAFIELLHGAGMFIAAGQSATAAGRFLETGLI